jgi:hypothetical protein
MLMMLNKCRAHELPAEMTVRNALSYPGNFY